MLRNLYREVFIPAADCADVADGDLATAEQGTSISLAEGFESLDLFHRAEREAAQGDFGINLEVGLLHRIGKMFIGVLAERDAEGIHVFARQLKTGRCRMAAVSQKKRIACSKGLSKVETRYEIGRAHV